jgi:hypothetical protein
LSRPIDLYLPRKQPKAAVPHHLLDLIEWNGAGAAFAQRGKPSKVHGGLYPLHAANAYQLSRSLSRGKGGGRCVYDDLDRAAWREIEAQGGTLLVTLPIEMLFPRAEMAQGILDGLQEAGLDPSRVTILNNNMSSPQWHAAHWDGLGVEERPRIAAFNGCYWMLRGGETTLPDALERAATREARWRETLGRPRARRFVSFNGRLRPLRSHLVLWLAANGWLDEGYVSLIGYGVPPEETERQIADWSRKYPEGEAIANALPALVDRMPLTIDFDRAQAETAGAYKRILPWTSPAPEPYDTSWFSFKVFTVEHAVLNAEEDEVMVWLDADSLAFDSVDADLLESTIPADAMLGYLGRSWKYSECGYVAYNLGHPATAAFVTAVADMYRTGAIFSLKEWHDSYVFDVVREHFEQRLGAHTFNISADVADLDHVFVNSDLGRRIDHLKGGRKSEGRSRSSDLQRHADVAYWAKTEAEAG